MKSGQQIKRMKIIHYMSGIPPVRGGGAIQYATDLMHQEIREGLCVFLLLPGILPWNTKRKSRIRKSRENYGQIPVYRIYNSLPVPMCNGILDIAAYTQKCRGSAYAEFLEDIKPDLIHIHTFMGLHREFLQEAEKYKIPVVYTTHDYFGICPTALMLSQETVCRDKEWKQCEWCCKNAYSKKRLCIEQSAWYCKYRKNSRIVQFIHTGITEKFVQPLRAPRIDSRQLVSKTDTDIDRTKQVPNRYQTKNYARLRSYYEAMFQLVSCFHFNSTLTRNIYESRLGILNGDTIGISHAGICDNRKKRRYGDRMRVGFFGSWTRHKGFFDLIDACSFLYRNGCRKLELHVYSDMERRTEPFVRNHRNFDRNQLGEIFDSIDLLAVPSRCPETFGLAVLEAVSYGVPVAASTFVGAKDILIKHPGIGFLYDGTPGGLTMLLRKIYDNRLLLEHANTWIADMDYDFSYQSHVDSIINLYKKLL